MTPEIFAGLPERTEVTLKLIERKICDYFKLSSDLLHSKSRKQPIPLCKYILCYLALKNELTQTEIQEFIGYFNHSSVIFARDRITERLSLKCEKRLRQDIGIIMNRIETGFVKIV